MEKTAYIHSVETCGTVDGPGLRFIVFFQGCTLRCKYCHNPDTWQTNCGTLTTVPELVEDVLKYRSYMKFSGGGVTVCGGEPLLQAKFITGFFKELKKLGISTCLDTSGNLKLPGVKELLTYTDLVLLDIKSLNPEQYRELTGGDLQTTLDFAEYLNEKQIPVWIRHVVIPDMTDGEKGIADLARYLKGMSNVKQVELLAFHKMGEEKWENHNFPYTLKDTPIPSPEKMQQLNEIFENT